MVRLRLRTTSTVRLRIGICIIASKIPRTYGVLQQCLEALVPQDSGSIGLQVPEDAGIPCATPNHLGKWIFQVILPS